jgi:hypothetical protein
MKIHLIASTLIGFAQGAPLLGGVLSLDLGGLSRVPVTQESNRVIIDYGSGNWYAPGTAPLPPYGPSYGAPYSPNYGPAYRPAIGVAHSVRS